MVERCSGTEDVGMAIELKRDIYEELLQWKNNNSGLVLEVEGARQVGKTYILDKFAREFACDFIVAGSYLGKTREKDFFFICR